MLKTFSGRNASQNEFELRSFIALLQEKNVTRYLEIGARHGDTFHEVMLALPAGSIGVAVDYPGALWGTEKSRNSLNRVINDLNFRGYHCTAIFGDSKDDVTIQSVHALGSQSEGAWPYDAALIDGDHRYAGVKADWENYCSAAQLIAFHDIVGHDQAEKVYNNRVEVPQLWDELKNLPSDWNRVHVEFIDSGSKMGIGVICV